jgi:hypothetical protein
MKVKSTELKKLINEAIKTETKALIREGYSREQLEEIDFAKVGNFFKGAARGVKDIAKDVNKNYFDNSDLNLQTDIKRLSKKKVLASQKVAELQKELSTYQSQLSKIESDISQKNSELSKIKNNKRGSNTKESEQAPVQSKEETPTVKKPIAAKPTTKTQIQPKGKNEPIDLNRDASTFQKDPQSGQRFRRKLEEVQMRTDLTNKMVRLCEKGNNCDGSYYGVGVANSFPYSKMVSNMSRYKDIDFSRIHKDDLTFELVYAWLELRPDYYFKVPKKYKDDMRIFKMCFDKGGISLLDDSVNWTFEKLKYMFDRDGYKHSQREIIKTLVASMNYLNKEQYIQIAKLVYKLIGDDVLNHIPRTYRDLVKDSNTDSRTQKLKALSTPFQNQKGTSETNQTELQEESGSNNYVKEISYKRNGEDKVNKLSLVMATGKKDGEPMNLTYEKALKFIENTLGIFKVIDKNTLQTKNEIIKIKF